MKHIRLLSFCFLTLAFSIGLNMAYWKGVDLIVAGDITQSIIKSVGGILMVYIVANYILGTVQSGLLNIFNKNTSFEIALICNHVIVTSYSLITFIVLFFKIDHEGHWIIGLISYFLFIGTTHTVLLKVSRASKQYKEVQELTDYASDCIKTAKQFADCFKKGEITFDQAIKSIDIIQPNDNEVKRVMVHMITLAKKEVDENKIDDSGKSPGLNHTKFDHLSLQEKIMLQGMSDDQIKALNEGMKKRIDAIKNQKN